MPTTRCYRRYPTLSMSRARTPRVAVTRHGELLRPTLWIYLVLLGLLGVVPGVWGDCPTLPTGCSCEGWYPTPANKMVNITCVDLQLTTFPTTIGKEGPSVYFLDFSKNNLTQLDSTHLSPFVNLIVLNISYNQLTTLTATVFSNLTNLQYLNLEGNSLTSIPSGSLSINTLTHLNLGGNANLDLSSGLKGLDIEVLVISHLNLTTFPKDQINSLDNLLELDASYNQITALEMHSLKITVLRKVNFSGNSLSSLDDKVFHPSKSDNIAVLDLSNNQLDTIDKDTFKDTTSLLYLDLSNNSLTTLDDTVFNPTVNLQHLYLNNNSQLQTLCKKTFSRLENLQTLSLSGNDMEKIDDELFKDATSLQVLDLSRNSISKIRGHFESLSSLTHLNLSYNELYTIKDAYFDNLINLLAMDISHNLLTCECKHKAVLYSLRHRLSPVTLNNEDDITCTHGSSTYLLLDWDSGSCYGYLGANCTSVSDCQVRYAQCNQTCSCADGYYDSIPTGDRGLCLPVVQLGSQCPLTVACATTFSICFEKTCVCQSGYYEAESDCLPSLALGESCTSNDQCGGGNATCGTGGTCDCLSTHYDNNQGAAEGECLLKLSLNASCSWSGQCGTANSECSNGKCSCESNFYSMDDTTCNEKNSSKRSLSLRDKRSPAHGDNLTKLCPLHHGKCALSSFYSCFPDESSGNNFEITFSYHETPPDAAGCKLVCFSHNSRYYIFDKNNCLCGNIASPSSCTCPSPTCSGKVHLRNINKADAGLAISPIPWGTVGIVLQFDISVTLATINSVAFTFGDSEKETNVSLSGMSVTMYHTYTRSGKYDLFVKVCIIPSGVCDEATLPVFVQSQPPDTWITGLKKVDVSKKYDANITATDGFNLELQWTRKDSNGNTVFRKECLIGWVMHRQKCVKLISATGNYSNAVSICQASNAKLVSFDFEDEISQILTAVGATTGSRLFYIGAQRHTSKFNTWVWASDGNRSAYAVNYMSLAIATKGCAVIQSSGSLTSVDCSETHEIICMTDPVDCPLGGTRHTDGHCFKLVTMAQNWAGAKSHCQNNFEGYLAVIKDAATQKTVKLELSSFPPSAAWIGLSTRLLPTYFQWEDNSMFDSRNSHLTGDDSHDCITISSSGEWKSKDCNSVINYCVCQYSINKETLTVPNEVTGALNLEFTSATNLTTLNTTSISFPNNTSMTTTLIPATGYSFRKAAELRYFVFKSANIPTVGIYTIALQIFEPVCTSPETLVQAGCAGSEFAMCSSTSHTCQNSSTCGTGEKFCNLDNTCIAQSKTCSCAKLSAPVCGIQTTESVPSYKLAGQIVANVTRSEDFFWLPVEGIQVKENDIIGFQHKKDKNPLSCEAGGENWVTTFVLENYQPLKKDDIIQVTNISKTDKNQTCLLQAITNEALTKSVPENIAWFNVSGSYNYSVSFTSSNKTNSLVVSLEELIGDIELLYPVIREQSVSTLGIIYVEINQSTLYSMMANSGDNMTAVFSSDYSKTFDFTSKCPAEVLSALPDKCDATSVSAKAPFVSMNHTITSPGISTLFITVSSSFGASKQVTVTVNAQEMIAGVRIKYQNSTLTQTVRLGRSIDFETSMTKGTAVTYTYNISGVSAASPLGYIMSYTFLTNGTYLVSVNVSNILGSDISTIQVEVRQAANFANCKFTNASYTAAVSIAISFEVTCDVDLGAAVTETWTDGKTSTPTVKSTPNTTTTMLTLTQSYIYTAVGSFNVTVVFSDGFEVQTLTTFVLVYNKIPSFTLSANKTSLCATHSTTFWAVIPVSPGSYGPIIYIWDFDDASALVTESTGNVTHVFSAVKVYSVSVTVHQGSSSQTQTITVTVEEEITGTVLSYSPVPPLSGEEISFTATGPGTRFHFFLVSGLNTSVTKLPLKHTFTTIGSYRVTVNTSNDCNSATDSLIVQVVNDTHLEITSLSLQGANISRCLTQRSEYKFDVDLVHNDYSLLSISWNFGDITSLTSIGVLTQKHIYRKASTFTVNVTVTDTSKSISRSITKQVCVQEAISTAAISLVTLVGLPSTGSATATATASVAFGSSLIYAWSSNVSTASGAASQAYTLTFTNVGIYFINLHVSNEISSNNVSKTVTVVRLAEGLVANCTTCQINCTTCIQMSIYYIKLGESCSFNSTVTYGDRVSHSLTFGDGNAGTGSLVSHSYSGAGKYTVTVSASSLANSLSSVIIVVVEDTITGLTLSTSGINWIKGKNEIEKSTEATVFATVSPTGVNAVYIWKFSDGLSSKSPTAMNTDSHTYTTAGAYTCTGVARNSHSQVESQLIIYVLERCTSVAIFYNGTNKLGNSTNNGTNKLGNNYVPADSTIAFTAVSNCKIQVTYSLSLRKGTALTKFSNTNILMNTFSGGNFIYSLQAKSENSLNSHTTEITIVSIDEITDPAISAASGNGNISLSTSITLTASISAGTDAAYNWSLSSGPPGAAALTSNSGSVTYMAAVEGDHVVVVSISNPLGVEKAYFTIRVYIAIQYLNISSNSSVLNSAETGDTTVIFSVTFTGSEATFSWSISLRGIVQETDTSTTLSVKFDEQGEYTISVTVTNPASSSQKDLIFYALHLVPAYVLAVSGTTYFSGSHYIETNTSMHFNSNLTNLDFLTFVWTINGNTGSTNTFSSSLTSAGTFIVQLTISNNIDSVTVTMTIIAEDPIQALTIPACSLVYKANEDINLNATFTGTNATLRWSPDNYSNYTGPTYIVKYDQSGKYNVTVNATNMIDSKTTSCQFTVLGNISNVQLMATPHRITNFIVSITLSGTNLTLAVITFQIPEDKFNRTGQSSNLRHNFTSAGNYTVKVTAENAYSIKSTSLVLVMVDLGCSYPEVTSTTNNRTIERGVPVQFDTTVTTNGCSSYNSTNLWQVYQTLCGSPLSSANKYLLPSSVAVNTPTLIIPKCILPYGNYCAVLVVGYRNTEVSKELKLQVTVVKSPLIALLTFIVTVQSGSKLILNASPSNDPDNSTALTYTWTCTLNQVSPAAAAVCAKITGITTSSKTLTDVNLVDGVTFYITVTVSALGRISGIAEQQIIVGAAEIPIITIKCITCEANGNYNTNPNNSIAFGGNCTGCDNKTRYSWTTIKTSTTSPVTLSRDNTNTGNAKINLVFKPGVLEFNETYNLTLTASNSDGKTGFATTTLSVKPSMSNGTCSVSNQTIIPLKQKATITCKDWTDNTTKSSGFYYKIIASSGSLTGSSKYVISYSTQPEVSVYVAPFSGLFVHIYVYILDAHGVGTSVKAGTIYFTMPVLGTNETMTGFLVGMTNTTYVSHVLQNDPTQVLQFAIPLLIVLNQESNATAGVSERVAIRQAVAYTLNSLLVQSLHNINQMASSLCFLTSISSEIQTQDLQQIVLLLVDELNRDLSSRMKQGHDIRDVPDCFLDTILNTNKANSQQTTTTEAISPFLDLSKFRIESGKSGSLKSYSTEDWSIYLNEETFKLTEELLLALLELRLAGEEPIIYKWDTMEFEALRELPKDIPKNNSKNGSHIIIPLGVSSKVEQEKDVFILFSLTTSQIFNTNSYIVGSEVNTKIFTFSIFSNSKKLLEFKNLLDPVKIYMFLESLTSIQSINGTLQNSPGYNSTAEMIYSLYSIKKNKQVKVSGFEQKSKAAIHIQIRVFFDVPSPSGVLNADMGNHGAKNITQNMMTGDHTQFTFFILPGQSTSDPLNIELNSDMDGRVYIGVYYTVCQFYNATTKLWEVSGCSPNEESIAICSVCTCDHMTSYGGTLFVSPLEIDFTDLTRLDIASNPVAIIICSVILGLYIAMVIYCWRLDTMDIKRISLIPLCGKDGSHKYEITMVTGRQIGAGTTANVGVRLVGEYNKTNQQHLYKPGAFQRNCADTFIVAHDVNLGELQKIRVWHDNRGTSPSWYLSYITVKDLQNDQKYYFFIDSWLTLEEENGTIQKEIKAAGAADMQRFSRRMKTAMFNSFADKHLWLSLVNRPAKSRFTRVQRATCCVTLLYTFIGVNAMWYGLLRQDGNPIGWSTYGWEEVILAIITNLMVFPINIGIIYLFKKSKSKSNFFEKVIKPGTAETLEIDNMCDNSNAGSFQGSSFFREDLERETTFESLPAPTQGGALRRTRNVLSKAQREKTDDSLQSTGIPSSRKTVNSKPMWNEESIMKWPDTIPINDDADSRPSTSTGSMVRQPANKGAGSTVTSSVKSDDKKTTSLRRPTMHRSDWGDLEDILHSDDESTIADTAQGRSLKKRTSTTSISSRPSQRVFNPREEPRINNDRTGRRQFLMSRESVASSRLGGESFYSSEPGITAGLRPGYYSEMTIEERNQPIPVHKEKCTLPPWCVYVAYFLCFVLSVFSIIIVILYCFKFGYEESVEWVLAFLLSLIQSLFMMEPLKAIFFAVYLVTMFKRVEEDEDVDVIDIEPSFDTSNEKIKNVKFKPVSGFALMQAKEEGHRILRMHTIIRQFVTYVFYMWLLMVICYVNFHQNSYYFTKSVEMDFVNASTTDHISFNNINTTQDYWEWSEHVLSESLYLYDSMTEEEHGFLLGAARLRQTRGTTVKCQAEEAAAGYHVPQLTKRTCYGDSGFTEDDRWYGELWNESTQNLSWRFFTATELNSVDKPGLMGWYGGGGYVQALGTSQSETLAILQDLQAKDWINLRTRAVMIEFAMYSPGSDMTAVVSLIAEFPVTGSVMTSYEIQSQKLLWFQEGRFDPLVIFEILLLVAAMIGIIHIVTTLKEQRWSYFKDPWNWYEMLTTLMTVVAVGMYIGCVVEATSAFNNVVSNQTSFTNFEKVASVHVATRYLHAFLIFLLFFKVVKQLRFIKFMHVYEITLSNAVSLLMGTSVIFFLLLIGYALLGHLMYGREVTGFESVGTSLATLTVIIRGSFDFWPLLDYQPVFSHFYLYSYYAFAYGIPIALVIAILIDTYKSTKSRMFFRSTLKMQDYEMIDFMLKRFKLWTGITKPKPAFRTVKFENESSISSRPSSSTSSISIISSGSAYSVGAAMPVGPEFSSRQITNMVARLEPTWLEVLRRFEKIEKIDAEEERLLNKTDEKINELNWKIKIKHFEKERNDILSWMTKDKPPLDPKKKPLGEGAKPKTFETRKAPASVSGASRVPTTPPVKGEKVDQGRRPLSDQGARGDNTPAPRSQTPDKKSIQSFFKSFKPSKPAWSK